MAKVVAKISPQGRALRGDPIRSAALAGLLVLSFGASPAAAGGRWVSDGITYAPTQADLAAVVPPPGRIYEKRISGGFQASETAIGTVELFFTDDDADHRIFLGSCTVSFRIEGGPMINGTGPYVTTGIVQANGNDVSKAAGGYCRGRISVDNADDAAVIADVPFGGTGNGQGTLVMAKGQPGATTTIHVGGYLSIGDGAHGGQVDAHFHWVGD